VALFCPAAVAVHYNRDMLGDIIPVNHL
jgi:hypothetical protein